MLVSNLRTDSIAVESGFSIYRLFPVANDSRMSNSALIRSVSFNFGLSFCFGILFFGFVSANTLQAAEPAPEKAKVSLTLVNALPGPENLHVLMAGQELWPIGFTPGQSTGAEILPAGKPAMEARCKGFATPKFNADFPGRSNCAMVFYPGVEIQDGPDKGKRKIGVFFPKPIAGG